MTEQQMFEFLKKQGFSDAGAAGAMGNMFAESGLKSNNLQNSFEKKLGHTDISYTKAVPLTARVTTRNLPERSLP